MSMQRKTVVLAGAITCAIAGLLTWAWLGSRSGVRYRTATIEHGDINVTISATGNPNAVVTVQVGSQVSGNILALFADFNTKVTKGELIAQIDPAPFQTRVNQAQANVAAARAAVANSQAVVQQALAGIQAANSSLAAAKANVVKAQAIAEDAKVKVDRRVIMVSQDADSKEDLETAQTTYKSAVADLDALMAQQTAMEDSVKVAQAQLNVAKSLMTSNQAQVKQFTAALQSAQIDLDHTNIKAPVDGIVVSRNVDVGQTVAASLAAPTLFLIAQDLTKMQVDTNVSEADVGRVRVNQSATFTVDAYPGQTFTGTVTSDPQGPHQRAERDHLRRRDWRVEYGAEAVSRHDGEREDSRESAAECAEDPQRRPSLSPRAPNGSSQRREGRRTGKGCLDPGRERQAAPCRGQYRRDRRHLHGGDRWAA